MKVLCFFLICLSLPVWAGRKVALVKILRGQAKAWIDGKPYPLAVDTWVEDGAIIKTAEKSFVKLIFTDKSQMNIGPLSLMKIESFTGKDSGVIDLVKGKIRSQVSKDYLQIQNKNKSKLFIKTKNAVMGVRGTDFMISTNGKNTATVLFEGEIAFNHLTEKGRVLTDRLEQIVDSGMRLFPGEFSVVEQDRYQPTIPALLNIQQREALEKNDGLHSDRAPSSAKTGPVHSVVPAGLDGKAVGNEAQVIKEVVASSHSGPGHRSPSSREPDGFVKDGLVKPANGSFVHIDSGTIIPPGPSSVLDKNSNTYIPGQESGQVNADGSYVPPKDKEITNDGKVLVVEVDSEGNRKTKEISKPVVSQAPNETNPWADRPMLTPPTLDPNGPLQYQQVNANGGINPSEVPGSNFGLNIQITH